MRRLSAPYIFTGTSVLKNGIIEIDSKGEILNVINTNGKLKETESLEYFSGVIVPGFVNAHCHLELSHMKGLIMQDTSRGLPGFIDEIISKRNFSDNLQEKIINADSEMKRNGIVAVGDISNTDDSFKIKKESALFYHTFIEVLTINNQTAQSTYEKAVQNLNLLKNFSLNGTIVPHAAYSVPDALYQTIIHNRPESKQIISVHNQETESEDTFIRSKKGALAEVLRRKNFEFADFNFYEKSAIEHTLNKQRPKDNILLIHNTFTGNENISFAENFSNNVYWVFCPLSNLYIENTLPDIKLFFDMGVKTCIGTDSYASNTELSILSELKIIVKHFPDIPFSKLIESACLNGAKALNINRKFGSIEVGKSPGINLIKSFDFTNMNLQESSKVQPLA